MSRQLLTSGMTLRSDVILIVLVRRVNATTTSHSLD